MPRTTISEPNFFKGVCASLSVPALLRFGRVLMNFQLALGFLDDFS